MGGDLGRAVRVRDRCNDRVMGTCPACDATLVWRHNGVWCDRCHRKVETCCEGAPQCVPEHQEPQGVKALGR